MDKNELKTCDIDKIFTLRQEVVRLNSELKGKEGEILAYKYVISKLLPYTPGN